MTMHSTISHATPLREVEKKRNFPTPSVFGVIQALSVAITIFLLVMPLLFAKHLRQSEREYERQIETVGKPLPVQKSAKIGQR